MKVCRECGGEAPHILRWKWVVNFTLATSINKINNQNYHIALGWNTRCPSLMMTITGTK
jgi:hypothetical protein